MAGSIDDWFLDRQDGSLGDARDDEAVERTPVWELPPEDPDVVATGAVDEQRELDALRRRNGLPSLPRPAARAARPAAQPVQVEPVASPAVGSGIAWHLRERIVDFARLYPRAGAKGIAVELLRRGTAATTAQVENVLRSLSPSERERVYGTPVLPASTSPSQRRPVAGRPQPRVLVCGSCGTSVCHLSRCACS